ncbi:CheB methylesterase [Arcticibacter svalbardensis MN12-7]|uniref:protein-glutamate methylesterase n=1 Tax=Arcticibacter svalbardensis MN12-7 TaxID=1150600 RepID=R9GTF5_9SPHI|nr:chemotaxis protein CheB [Arcticibacter svalbardensis]EOR94830.1 CheB methylesterase [Arcticibacter svalbardensis MN12-7]
MSSWGENEIRKAREAKVLLLGGSAGGFNLVFELVRKLPLHFPLPVVVVIHRSRNYPSFIEEILDRKSELKVVLAVNKEKISKGKVYFAPSDYHLLLEPDGSFTLDYSEPVLHSRPSIDVTFQSVADVYQDKIVAILFSGASEDGSYGLCYIKEKKGLVIIQDPKIAEVKTMPQAALSKCKDALVLTNEGIFAFIDSISEKLF